MSATEDELQAEASGRALAELSRQAEALRERIREADYAYYVLDNPIMSDAEYDQLMRSLRAIEAQHPCALPPASGNAPINRTISIVTP